MLIRGSNPDSFRFGLVFKVLSDLAVIPLADLLIGLFGEIHALGCISSISHGDGIGFALDGNINNGPADLVLDVPHDPFVLSLESHPNPAQFLVPARAVLCPGKSPVDSSKALVVSLLFVAKFAASDDNCFLLIPYNSGVDFPEIDGHDVVSRRFFRLSAVLNDDVPEVLPGSLLENETHFEESQGVFEIFGQPDFDLAVSPAVGENQHATFILDGRVLPDGSAESLPPVRKPGIRDSGFTRLPGGFAGFVKTLLGGIYRVSVQDGSLLKEIVDPLCSTGRNPDSLLAVCAPVIYANTGINTPGLHVKSVTYRFWKITGDDVSADHCFPCCSMYFRIVSLLTLPAVLAKYERVHNEGNLIRGSGYCFRKHLEVTPLHSFTTSAALSVGQTCTKRWI
jgi:hypothetical protein